MLVQKDTFLIQVEQKNVSDIGIKGANGQFIQIDTDYNKYKHSTQVGKVYACPIQVTQKYDYDTELKVDDVVLFHHFVCQPDHKINVVENVYRCEYFHIYAKMEDKKVVPIEDVIFVEPILEDESNMYSGVLLIKSQRENLKQQGIVFAASKKAQKRGILAGDKVFFTQNAEYPMKVLDKDLYRMRIRNIIAVERNGELVCLSNKLLIKQIPEENKVGVLLSSSKQTQLKGEVVKVGTEIKGAEVGDIVSYYNGVEGSLYYNGETYSFIELRNLNYIIN